MEPYQETRIPSISRNPPITASAVYSAAKTNDTSLPPELCSNCCHGYKLGLCPDITSHLQEMKYMLIALGNELLDDAYLSPGQMKKLSNDRLLLNRKLQLLEAQRRSNFANEERWRSHFAGSETIVGNTGYNVRQNPAFNVNPVRLDNWQNTFDGQSSYSRCRFSTASDPFADTLDFVSLPMERELYTAKNMDVNCIEGSSDKKWSSKNFPWTKKLEENNRTVFGNPSFRPNQREIINATMSGCDVFVLMPGGGGKSLTYQLPAIMNDGVTLVISPLVSLIQDQIIHAKKANIRATYLSSNMDWTEQLDILRDLCQYKLLYVTPEKIAKSDSLLHQLDDLCRQELVARIVVDEAHCISQCGHDFRPDYQGLGILKRKFPNTPVLALTATATKVVTEDVVQALGLVKCVVFRKSFNRQNLTYSVVPKTNNCMEEIDKFIKKTYPDQSGIIYCLSRIDCEKVAEKLKEYGHKTAFYHGSMGVSQRKDIQKQWSNDEINIICATMSFGIGIDKADVRFVIHHSIPKSIEDYHRECGHAGRDGLPANCMLFYNYSDYIHVKAYQREVSTRSGKMLETAMENLLLMVSYCENEIDCRRLLQLAHFGENFDSANCKNSCDNCGRAKTLVDKDVTEIAKQLVELVKSTTQNFASSHILEVYCGSLAQNIKKHKHDTLKLHGAGKHLPKGEASRVLRYLVTKKILVEDVEKSDFHGSVSSVLKVDESKYYEFCSRQQRIVLRFPSDTKASLTLSNPEVSMAKNLQLSGKTTSNDVSNSVQPQTQPQTELSNKLYTALRQMRTKLVKDAEEGLMGYHIFTNSTLWLLSTKIPRTKEDLLEISGIGIVKAQKYGDIILETIESTCDQYNLEDVEKSDLYGSVSSVLKVDESKYDELCSRQQCIVSRSPSNTLGNAEVMTAKNLQPPGKMTLNKVSNSVQPQTQPQTALGPKLYIALRQLRTELATDEGLMAYHIFTNATLQQLSQEIPRTKADLLKINCIDTVKVQKYGDSVLKTIESICDQHNLDKTGSSRNSIKRSRTSLKGSSGSSKSKEGEDEDFMERVERPMKRATRLANSSSNGIHPIELDDLANM